MFDRIKRRIILGAIAFLAVVIVFGAFSVVDEGERGVVLTLGAFNGRVMEPGLNFKLPLIQTVVKYDVRTTKLEIVKSSAYSKDLQPVDIHSVVNYAVKQSEVGSVYAKFNRSVEERVLSPLLESTVKQVIAKYTAEELLSMRGEVQSQIGEALKASCPREIEIQAYQLVNEDFSDLFESAIEAKQVAAQNAERAVNEKLEAETRALTTVITAKAQAEAIRIQTDAINSQGGQNYVAMESVKVNSEAVKKWNGVLPTYVTGGTALPFIGIK
jgi:regulator of protease activity HflC (stomatin/prohibitin superfamily)